MKDFKDLREAVSPAQQAAIAIAKKEKGIKESPSKQFHVRMDNLGKDQKKVGDILRKYEKNGSIEFDGETDKGVIFTVKKPSAIATLNRELKPYYTSAELDEAVDNDDKGEYDNEGEMAKTQLRGVVADASHMIKMFSDDQNLPEWVQAKITKAADYLKSAHSYMMNKDEKTDVKEITFHQGIGSGGDEVMKQLLKRLKKSGGAPDLQKDLERRLNNKSKGK